MCEYGWWLKQHGLIPNQVDALPAWFEIRYGTYSELFDQVVAERRQG